MGQDISRQGSMKIAVATFYIFIYILTGICGNDTFIKGYYK